MIHKISEYFVKHTALRILFAVLMPMLFFGLIFIVYFYRELFQCPFYALTGLYCPGCGSGRAMTSILHLDFLAAMQYNILAVLALPLVGYYFVGRYLAIVIGREVLPIFKTSVLAFNIVLILILVYGILRNLPFYPFSLLAP